MKKVVLIGRPNAGKSSLFNALAGRDLAIISAKAHTTRDVNRKEIRYLDQAYLLSDCGGIGESQQKLDKEAMVYSEKEIKTAELVLFVLSAEGLGTEDRHLVAFVRKLNKPTLLVIQKADLDPKRENLADFSRLGFKEIVWVSSKHPEGLGQLKETIYRLLGTSKGKKNKVVVMPPNEETEKSPTSSKEEAREAAALAFAQKEKGIVLLGRPNVGKSSLFNLILEEERSIVSEISGTTRDAVVERTHFGKHTLRLVDTAGLRARSKISEEIESFSVGKSLSSIRSADGVFLVIDSVDGLTEQDKKIADVIVKQRKPFAILVNKWDLPNDSTWPEFEDRIRFLFPHASHVPVYAVSAKTGEGIRKPIKELLYAIAHMNRQLPTGELNRILQKAIQEQEPKVTTKGFLKIYYGVQTGQSPPIFRIFVNDLSRLKENYVKYIETTLRTSLELGGGMLIIEWKNRAGKSANENRLNKPKKQEEEKPKVIGEDSVSQRKRNREPKRSRARERLS